MIKYVKASYSGESTMYRGCSIIDMGDSYVCTNKFGTTIGQAKSEYDCEDIIDTYLNNSEAKSETDVEQDFMRLADAVRECLDYFHYHNKNLNQKQDNALYELELAYDAVRNR